MTNERQAEGAAGDPSMEEILASIRRILSEDEKTSEAKPPPTDDVLVLDPSMMVSEIIEVTPTTEPLPKADPPEPAATSPEVAQEDTAHPGAGPMGAGMETRPSEAAADETGGAAGAPSEGLVAPDTAESAASSIIGLMRTLAADRATPVHRTGPTIEDLVREELRPLLKAWLDTHLPLLVERLVRTEIERVVNRATS